MRRARHAHEGASPHPSPTPYPTDIATPDWNHTPAVVRGEETKQVEQESDH